jgi:hypothetical protein
MNEQRIRTVANAASAHAEDTVEYYHGIDTDGLTWESKILKARDLKFAELIVQETLNVALYGDEHAQARDNVKTLFGVEND